MPPVCSYIALLSDPRVVFDDMFEKYTHNITNNPDIRGDSAARMVNNWYLVDLNDMDTIYSDTTTIYDNEQMFIDRGISVSVTQVYEFGRIWIGQYYNDNGNGDLWHDMEGVVAISHLGASTEEAEDNCATMAASHHIF